MTLDNHTFEFDNYYPCYDDYDEKIFSTNIKRLKKILPNNRYNFDQIKLLWIIKLIESEEDRQDCKQYYQQYYNSDRSIINRTYLVKLNLILVSNDKKEKIGKYIIGLITEDYDGYHIISAILGIKYVTRNTIRRCLSVIVEEFVKQKLIQETIAQELFKDAFIRFSK